MHLETHSNQMTSYVRAFAEQSRRSKASDFLHSLEVANTMYATLGPLLEKYNVLVCPTTALPAVAADFDYSRDSITINGKIVNPMLGWVMTTPFNTMSRCPVLTLPSGRAANGVPTSLQVIGRTYCDKDVFRAGMAFEQAAGRWFENDSQRPTL